MVVFVEGLEHELEDIIKPSRDSSHTCSVKIMFPKIIACGDGCCVG